MCVVQEHLELWHKRIYKENGGCYFKATGPAINTEAAPRFFDTWEAKVSGPCTMYRFFPHHSVVCSTLRLNAQAATTGRGGHDRCCGLLTALPCECILTPSVPYV